MNEADWLASDDPAAMLRHLTRGQQWLSETHAAPVARPSDRKLRLFAVAMWWRRPDVTTDLQARDMAEAFGLQADGLASPAEVEAVGTSPSLQWYNGGLPYHEWVAQASRHLIDPLTAPPLRDAERQAQANLLRDIVGNPWRPVAVRPEWRTPDVLALARAAYDERDEACPRCAGKGEVYPGTEADEDDYACATCGRPAGLYGHLGADGKIRCPTEPCPACHGAGRGGDGRLDPQCLAVLSDALEEAGVPPHEDCPHCAGTGRVYDYMDWQSCSACDRYRRSYAPGCVPHPLLCHLRSPGPHARGCWALDLALGKE